MSNITIGQLLFNNAVDENFNPLPNVDAKYGPWNSNTEAITNIPRESRAKGLTVGIIENGKIVEYWWESSIENSGLIKKQSTGGGGGDTYTLYLNNNITEDSNTYLNSLYASANIKDIVIDTTNGGMYYKYNTNKWTKINSTILQDTAPIVTSIREVNMISIK